MEPGSNPSGSLLCLSKFVSENCYFKSCIQCPRVAAWTQTDKVFQSKIKKCILSRGNILQRVKIVKVKGKVGNLVNKVKHCF